MINSCLQEYKEYEAARSYCLAYGASELSFDPLENTQSIMGWDKTNTAEFTQIEPSINACLKIAIVRKSGLFDKQDPFTQMGLLSNEEERVKDLILRVQFSLTASYRQALATRILTLFKIAKEEDENGVGISFESLRHFYYFLCAHPYLKRPRISLTPQNNIYASWKAAYDKVLSIHFMPNGDARFVIFAPNKKQPERPILMSGKAPVDILMSVIEPHGVKSWAAQ